LQPCRLADILCHMAEPVTLPPQLVEPVALGARPPPRSAVHVRRREMGHEGVVRETSAMLGLKQTVRPLEFVMLIRKGLPSAALKSVAKHMDLSALATVESLGLAKRTIARRLQEKKPLSPEESERLVRLARVLAQATEVLGSVEKARRWLQKPSRALGGEVPIRMLDTDVGATAVTQELGRIDYGVFA
jgi:putative toxin-antitoxin system antitoxin component (TIGR02293 family)